MVDRRKVQAIKKVENRILTDLRSRLKKMGIKYQSVSMYGPLQNVSYDSFGKEIVRVDATAIINLPKNKEANVFYDIRNNNLIPPKNFSVYDKTRGKSDRFEFSKEGFNEFYSFKRVVPTKGAPKNYMTSLRETAQDIDPSVKATDINNQEDFINVCRANNWDSFSCLGYLRRAGVKRLTKKSIRLLRDEDAWSEFDDEIYFDSEVYPEGPE